MELAKKGNTRIYGLNYKDDREEAIRWLDKFGDPYIQSAFDQNGKVGIDLGVYGVPETFVLDRDGVIRYKFIGPITAQLIQDTLLPLLERLEKPEI
jgi:cytochrome c biogenesis protein CcmG/thiol:disulfide interchange protein DsbE